MAALSNRGRFAGLDTIRGITLVSMMAYHACWDLVYLFGKDWVWYRSSWAYLWQQSICWTFILLSGFCFHLGRRHLRRGLLVFGGGVLISVVTMLFMPQSRIFCGVLSLLGMAMLLTTALHPLLKRVPVGLGVVFAFGLFLLTRDVNSGYLGFEGLRLAALPGGLYLNLFTAVLGFPPANFYSSDYFSLLPWLFLFWTGYFLYPLRCKELPTLRLPVLTWLGRHSLVVYLLHQVVIYAVLTALAFLHLL